MKLESVLILLVFMAGASIVYADWDDITITQDFEISDGDQYVRVMVRRIDNPVTVNVTGGNIGTLYGYNDSIINVMCGTFRQEYYNYHPKNNDGDDLYLCPTIHSIVLQDSSTLNYYGADVFSVFGADESTINVFDGTISLTLAGKSNVNITGGQITGIGYNRPFQNPDYTSHVSISGGTFSGKFSFSYNTVVDIYGYGFVYDPDGWVNEEPRFRGTPGGRLSGFWADGTPFTMDFIDRLFFTSSYSHVVLHEIPEPASLSLIGFGVLLARQYNLLVKRKRRLEFKL